MKRKGGGSHNVPPTGSLPRPRQEVRESACRQDDTTLGPPRVRSRVRGHQVDRAVRVVGWNGEVPELCDRSGTLVVGLCARGARGRHGRASCARWSTASCASGIPPAAPAMSCALGEAAQWATRAVVPTGAGEPPPLSPGASCPPMSRCHTPRVPAARGSDGGKSVHPRRSAQRTLAHLIVRLSWGHTSCVARLGVVRRAGRDHRRHHDESSGPTRPSRAWGAPSAVWVAKVVDDKAMSHLRRGAARPRQGRSPSSGEAPKSATVREYVRPFKKAAGWAAPRPCPTRRSAHWPISLAGPATNAQPWRRATVYAPAGEPWLTGRANRFLYMLPYRHSVGPVPLFSSGTHRQSQCPSLPARWWLQRLGPPTVPVCVDMS